MRRIPSGFCGDDYYGLVEIEYKLDPRDGVCRLLDVNGRAWGYHTLGPRAGVDFAPDSFLIRPGRRWRARGRAAGWVGSAW